MPKAEGKFDFSIHHPFKQKPFYNIRWMAA